MSPILVICNDTDYFLRHRLHVVERLVALGFDVTVATGGRRIPPGTAKGWRPHHIPIKRFSFDFAGDIGLFVRSLVLAWKIRPEAVHLITLKPAVFSGSAMILARFVGGAPRKILITIPGLGRLMSPKSTTHEGHGLARWLVARAIRLVSGRPNVHFTFETAHDRDHWVHKGLVREDNSSVVLGAGVDPEVFHPNASRTGEGPTRVLFASRLLKSKGLDAFIAMARRFGKRDDAQFFVAGMVEESDPDGYAKSELESEGTLTFLGEVKDMGGLLRGIDVVCLPTRYGEGIPRILIEAAAAGIACVTTDLDGCAEIVSDGKSGFLVPVGDDLTDGLVTSLQRYLDDPEMLRAHGREAHRIFASGAFDEDAVVESFIAHLVPDAAGATAMRDGKDAVSTGE